MVESDFSEAFSEEWKKQNIGDLLNELVILRRIIPRQRITERPVPFYCKGKGRIGNPIRMMVALLLLARLRHLSDEEVVKQVKENRYMQYFCNVPDQGLHTFLNASTLCIFRKRPGPGDAECIEKEVFGTLRRAEVIGSDTQLTDPTVLTNHLIYPTDVLLLYKAFGKMAQFANRNKLPVWWDESCLKNRWRACNLAKKKEKHEFLWKFYLLFGSGLQIFRIRGQSLSLPQKEQEKVRSPEELPNLPEIQTEQKPTFHIVDKWVHRRLRSILRKRIGLHGISRGHDHFRQPNRCFRDQGLFSLVEAHRTLFRSSSRKTTDRRAVCGRSAGTVRREGRR